MRMFGLKTKNYKLKTSSGFSYIEFLIVITLIVITSVGGILTVVGFYRAQAPRAALKTASAALGDARNRAIVQEGGAYWGVRFESLPGRDRYTLFSASTTALGGFVTSTVTMLPRGVDIIPAETTILFDKMTGSRTLPACVGNASTTIAATSSALHIQCNGRIDAE